MEQSSSTTYSVTIKKLPQSKIEISATIPAATFDATRSKAVKELGADVALDGFRKGHVPEKVLLAKLGEGALLETMAEIAIGDAYPKIIVSEKIDALGRPEVRITKIAPGNPLEFTLITAVFPVFTLPDYKKLAAKETKKKELPVVTEDEVEKTITQIRTMRSERDQEGKAALPEGETPELPPFDDALVKTLGDFATVEEFKSKLRENILKEKEREAKDKLRVRIMEAIIADTKMEIPEIIIDQELHRMEDEFAHEIERMGMNIESYTKAVGKTPEDLRKEWMPDAEKRAKVQLVTSKIAETEQIIPDQEQLDKEAAVLKSHYPDASDERIRDYLSMILTNDLVFKKLEEANAGD